MEYANDNQAGSSASAPAGEQTARAPDRLRGTSYAAGAAALSPRVQLRGAGAQVLSPGDVQEAITYNRARGFSAPRIRQIQRAVGTPDDGVIGPNTVRAIARFQGSRNLTVDGKFGPNTELALKSVIPEPQDPQPTERPPEESNTPPPAPGMLSANFSHAEFKSKDGAATPQWVLENLYELAAQLEVLRAAAGGKACSVTSGYRSPAHNRAVGGASKSEHMKGQAADLNVAGMAPAAVKTLIERLISEGKMKQGGIGLYSTFVHYDTRGYAARW